MNRPDLTRIGKYWNGTAWVPLRTVYAVSQRSLNPPIVTAINVTPLSGVINPDETSTIQFSATVVGLNLPSQAVNWRVFGNEDPLTNIDENGLLTLGNESIDNEIRIIANSIFSADISGESVFIINRLMTDQQAVDQTIIWLKENDWEVVRGLNNSDPNLIIQNVNFPTTGPFPGVSISWNPNLEVTDNDGNLTGEIVSGFISSNGTVTRPPWTPFGSTTVDNKVFVTVSRGGVFEEIVFNIPVKRANPVEENIIQWSEMVIRESNNFASPPYLNFVWWDFPVIRGGTEPMGTEIILNWISDDPTLIEIQLANNLAIVHAPPLGEPRNVVNLTAEVIWNGNVIHEFHFRVQPWNVNRLALISTLRFNNNDPLTTISTPDLNDNDPDLLSNVLLRESDFTLNTTTGVYERSFEVRTSPETTVVEVVMGSFMNSHINNIDIITPGANVNDVLNGNLLNFFFRGQPILLGIDVIEYIAHGIIRGLEPTRYNITLRRGDFISDRDFHWLTWNVIRASNVNQENIISNLNLPTVGPEGSVIEWESSNISIMNNSGVLLNPNGGAFQMTATITATGDGFGLSDAENIVTRVFNLTAAP